VNINSGVAVDELSAQVKNYKADLKNLKRDLQNLSEKSDRMSLLGGSDRDIVRANSIDIYILLARVIDVLIV